MAQITFEDKETLIDNPDIDEKNKITADNVNEIKRVVNENGSLSYDSLPVNSIIDYEGVNIPDGYIEFEDDDPIEITEYFSSDFNIDSLRAYYYPSIKKVEIIFAISGVVGNSDTWVKILDIKNPKYEPKSAFYNAGYGSGANVIFIGADPINKWITCFKKSYSDLYSGILSYSIDGGN